MEEVTFREGKLRVTFPDELREYLSIFGNGFDVGSSRDVDTLLMQDFGCLSYDLSTELLALYSKSGVFGEELPLLSSGGEYISLVWTTTAYAVVWKVNDYGFPSWVWPSVEALFSFMCSCWREGACRFDFKKDSVDWDSRKAMELFANCGGRLVDK
jgi:hypothetical protein